MDKSLKQITKGSAINIIGTLFSYGSRFIIVYLLVRGLGSENYGLYVIAITIFGVLAEIAQFGLPQGVIRYLSIFRSQKDWSKAWGVVWYSLGITFLLSCVLSITFYYVADIVSIRWFKSHALETIINQASWIIPLEAMFFLSIHAFTGMNHMKYRTYLTNFYTSFVWFIIVMLFYFLKPGLIFYFWGKGILLIFGLILSIFLLKKYIIPTAKLRLYQTKKIITDLVIFSLPLVFSRIINIMLSRTDIFMIGLFLHPTQVAIYHVAGRLADIQGIMLHPVNTAMAPVSAKLLLNNRITELSLHYQTISRWMLGLAFPLSLVLILFSKELLAFFEPGFSSSNYVLVVILLSNLFNISTGSSGLIITMAGYTKLNLINSSFGGALNVILNFVLIPRIGLMGAALATAVSIVAINLLRIIELYYIFHMSPYTKYTTKIIISSALSYISTYVIISHFQISPVVDIFVGSIIILAFYFTMLILFGLAQEDKDILSKAKGYFFYLVLNRKEILN